MTKEDALKNWVWHFDAMKCAIEALKAQEWIPANIPPKQEANRYLIQTDSGYLCSYRWTNVNPFYTGLTTDWHWNPYDVPQHCKVVAWMPEPELYMSESMDKE